MLRSTLTRLAIPRDGLSLRAVSAVPLYGSHALRSYSTAPKQEEKADDKKDKKVNFRSFITVGIFASIILTQVVDAVNKEKPRPRSLSESEYYQQQARLRRKVSRFTPDNKEVYFVKAAEKVEKSQIRADGFTVIDPSDLVEMEKNDEHSKFHALLNDPSTTTIPRGVVIDLIGNFLATQPDGKFVVLNFPSDIKESTQFEDKIVTIKSLINVGQSETTDDVVKYYKTVDKVNQVSSVADIKV
ncbi:CYFA0S14e02784g1_1 [Cyberlindnera fabianii]|uniref:Altered inheritance of mitochondria protein 36, mitochondrial n=1 Tax=Cyberlindnera fabianii TaxID=36022 RepID=A0A061B980_CYBFA|nr:Altered inheritance of mitochondria protein 36, mitochondrial [Cyberlindnera fabianii]CDR44443.1 CYFA0S14e02784g1_1 [Cyberlindnera fabianii]